MDGAALLKAIIETAIDGIITIDDRGIIESMNPAACQLFGYEAEEVIGKNVSILMSSPDRERHGEYINNYRISRKPKIIGIGREVRGLRKDGISFPFRLSVSEVQFSGRMIYTGFIHDLSKEKEAEERLKQYAQHLEAQVEERTHSLRNTIQALQEAKQEIQTSLEKEKELNILKSQFVTIASHEFRTPLSKIQLSASLIDKYAEPFQNAHIKKHIKSIGNAIINLTSILNDFLNLERLDTGSLKPQIQVFNIKVLGTEITEEMQSLTKSHQEIQYKHNGILETIRMDQNLLRNCIVNLLSNSIKYSEENTLIDFRTEIKDEKLQIRIKDEGIGIPEKDQKHLFNPFFRAGNTGNTPGTGLGLNIVSRYTRIMNGQIEFKSQEKIGTEFTLSFPLH